MRSHFGQVLDTDEGNEGPDQAAYKQAVEKIDNVWKKLGKKGNSFIL